jgi:hypothetical protein
VFADVYRSDGEETAGKAGETTRQRLGDRDDGDSRT